jgi:hypothetical protein
MSILINGKKLEVGMALRDENDPMHGYAIEYSEGLKALKEKHGQFIKFVRPGYPKINNGADSKGRDAVLVEPDTPAMFPLERAFPHPLRGEEIWSCCLNMPKLLPNGLWSIGNKRSLKINQYINVNIDKQPDLAYYLYYIADFWKRGGRLKIDDPQAEIREKANKERELLERKSAIWQMLKDEDQLRKMAGAYGVPFSSTKDPDSLRFDLEAVLEKNDNTKRFDPNLKGTKEFLEEMKVTDNVRLRYFLKTLEDDKKLVYKPDGRYRVGDKLLMQVPQADIEHRFEYLCSYYAMPNNAGQLKELFVDVIDKAYLDKVKDDKDFVWIAKVMGINTAFQKKEDLKSKVYEAFNIVL